MKKIIDFANRHKIIYCFAIIGFLLLITYCLIPIKFETNDDITIMYSLAGYRTGTPISISIYSNKIYGYIIAHLYQMIPTVPWYTVAHLSFVYISLVIIYFSILDVKQNKDYRSFITRSFIFLILYFLVYLYPSVILQFTTTPTLIGSAACLLILSLSNNNDDMKKNITKLIISAVMLIIAYMYRAFVGYVCIAYFGLCALIKLIYYKKHKNIKAIIIIITVFISTLICILGSFVIDTQSRSGEAWDNFTAYHKERTAYTDYGHPDFDKNQELYKKVGWDKDLYDLTSNWFFMDRRFNTENLKIINNYNKGIKRSLTAKEKIDNAINTILNLYNSKKSFFIAHGVLLTVFIIILLIKNRKIGYISICYLISFLCMFAYLCIKGRMPFRSFQSIYIPLITVLAYMISSMKLHLPKKELQAIIVFSCLMICSYQGNQVYLKSISIQTSERNLMEQYCINNPNNIYIYDITLALSGSPFTTYPNQKPTNSLFWGGSTMNSPIYFQQLQINGYKEFFAERFIDGNVYYMSKKKDVGKILNYMKNNYGARGIIMMDNIEDIYVYKFI